ncbi:MAG: dihydrofolate reductase [Bacillota bacterium]
MISIVVAMAKNRVIGCKNRIPWRLPADLAYFKRLTVGHPVIMGRRTFESIGKPLPGRENVVITGNQNYQPDGCLVLHSLEEARRFCSGRNVFIIGGARVYEQFFPDADKLYITLIGENFAGDAFFPEIDEKRWKLVSKTDGVKDEKNPYRFAFLVYEKQDGIE